MKRAVFLFLLCGASCAQKEPAPAVAAKKPAPKAPAVVAASVLSAAAPSAAPDPEYVRADEMLDTWDGDGAKVDEARAIAMKMLAGNTAYAPAYVILARCELDGAYMYGNEWDLAGTTRARKFADHALKLDPANVDAMLVSAKSWLALHDYDASLHVLDDVDAARPGNPEAKGFRVVIDLETGKYKEGVALAKEVVASPDARTMTKWSAYSDIAWIEEALGYKDGADDANRAAIALAPNSAWGHGNYSHFLLKRGDIDGAITEGERAVKLKPYPLGLETLARAYIAKASALFDARQYRDAGGYVEKALALAGNNARTNLAAGMFYAAAYNRSRDHALKDRAIAAFKKTLDLDPGNGLAEKQLEELNKT
ncbi:MAG TPA: tetratricopeptide repeat protein [Thermoanaerobaculia bacterium]|jgi:tetratricopeptide (TPR) repeat protein|nr:tetratricopeptide repeat protein [Thermoanaerobaculia bacterium]